jgi:bifunctional ADP-heptose synthase (sugar kinase/adenylyltransferase)
LNETDTLGGAGNVALNAVAYQADVTIFGTCGDDVSGKKLAKRFQDARIKFFDDCVNPAANTICLQN